MAIGDSGSGREEGYRPNPDVVHNTTGDRSVLVNIRTNRIYELNRTGTRFWELLCEGHGRAGIRDRMMQEFAVAASELDGEIDDLLASLTREQLVVPR